MKALIVSILILSQMSTSVFANCELNGKYMAKGNWSGMNEWYLTFENNKLVASSTDQLSSKEWPTTLEIQDGKNIKINSTSFGGDAILEATLIFELKDCDKLQLKYAYEVFIDMTGSDGDSIQRTLNTKLVKLK